jgi:hypothetical protein
MRSFYSDSSGLDSGSLAPRLSFGKAVVGFSDRVTSVLRHGLPTVKVNESPPRYDASFVTLSTSSDSATRCFEAVLLNYYPLPYQCRQRVIVALKAECRFFH